MTIVTLSRGAYGGIGPLVECLAGELGSRVLSREELLADTAKTYKASASHLESALQHRPGFLEGRGLSRLHYLYCAQATLAKAAQADNLVYHGEGGHLLLPGVAHHLRVRTIGNVEHRIELIMEQCELSREKAIDYMRKLDEQRMKWAHWVHGIDTTEPKLFDLTVNLERVSVGTACAAIVGAARHGFQTTPESQRTLDELALTSEVRARVGLDSSIPDERIEITAAGGVVTLRAKTRFVGDVDRAAALVRTLAGVERVESDLIP